MRFASIGITGINGGSRLHGAEEVLVSETTLVAQYATLAIVSLGWTTDVNLTHSPETYTVCVQAIVNSQPFGVVSCRSYGPF